MRRDRNDSFGEPAPEKNIPEYAGYLWEWFFEAIDSVSRIHDGKCRRLDWTQWAAWRSETGHIVCEHERAILRAMDAAYCVEMDKELADYQARLREAAKREAERNK